MVAASSLAHNLCSHSAPIMNGLIMSTSKYKRNKDHLERRCCLLKYLSWVAAGNLLDTSSARFTMAAKLTAAPSSSSSILRFVLRLLIYLYNISATIKIPNPPFIEKKNSNTKHCHSCMPVPRYNSTNFSIVSRPLFSILDSFSMVISSVVITNSTKYNFHNHLSLITSCVSTRAEGAVFELIIQPSPIALFVDTTVNFAHLFFFPPCKWSNILGGPPSRRATDQPSKKTISRKKAVSGDLAHCHLHWFLSYNHPVRTFSSISCNDITLEGVDSTFLAGFRREPSIYGLILTNSPVCGPENLVQMYLCEYSTV